MVWVGVLSLRGRKQLSSRCLGANACRLLAGLSTSAQSTDERFLNQILSIVDRAEHAVAVELNLAPVNFGEILERLFIYFRPIRNVRQGALIHSFADVF